MIKNYNSNKKYTTVEDAEKIRGNYNISYHLREKFEKITVKISRENNKWENSRDLMGREGAISYARQI